MNKDLLEIGLRVYRIASMSHGIVDDWNEDFVYVNYDYNTPVSIYSNMKDRSQATLWRISKLGHNASSGRIYT